MQNKRGSDRTHADLSGLVDWGASVSLDAERQLLGLMLTRGDVFDQVGTDVAPVQFYEPLHRRMFDLVTASRSKGLSITRDRLGDLLRIDTAFTAAGGMRYLDSVMQAAAIAEVEGVDVRELAHLVVDLYVRREVIKAATDIAGAARGDGLKSGRELRDMMEARLYAADGGSADRQGLRTIGDMTRAALDNSKRGGVDLLSCGLAKIDKRAGRFERGDFVLLGARPSMGKSALASCIAMNAATGCIGPDRNGVLQYGPAQGAIEFHGEMSEEQVARRHLSDMAYSLYDQRAPSYRDIRDGKLDVNQAAMVAEAQRRLDPLPIMAMRKREMTLGFVRSTARRQVKTWRDQGVQLGWLIVDSINNMKVEGDRYLTPVERMTILTAGLKGLAIELNCVLVALSQLSRKLEDREDKRPTLPDLRESGSLEQDADVVCGIYRDAYYAEREAKPKKEADRTEWLDRRGSTTMEVIFLKVKEGAPGTEKMHVDVARNAVRDEFTWGTEKTAPGELPLHEAARPNDWDEVPL